MTARRNIMRKFVIGEISAVDVPCQEHARAVIFKRGSAPQEPRLEAIRVPTVDDWGKRRETALQALHAGAEALSKAEGLSGPAAYDAFLCSPAGAELYQQAS